MEKSSLKRMRPIDMEEMDERKEPIEVILSTKSSEACSRPFQNHWLEKFIWLEYDDEKNNALQTL